MKAMKEPAFVEKLKGGPVGFLTILPKGEFPMGKTLSQWTVYCLAIGVMVAYVTGRTLGADASYLEVFRISGTVAFLAYAGGTCPIPSGGASPSATPGKKSSTGSSTVSSPPAPSAGSGPGSSQLFLRARPGRAPVWSPSRTTDTPLTTT